MWRRSYGEQIPFAEFLTQHAGAHAKPCWWIAGSAKEAGYSDAQIGALAAFLGLRMYDWFSPRPMDGGYVWKAGWSRYTAWHQARKVLEGLSNA